MISYVERRRRRWDMLQRLDPKIGLSETLLGELLLDHSGLSSTERLMIVTSTFNNLDFDIVAEALIKQHALRESIHGNKGKGKGFKGGKTRAYLANEDWNGSWEEPEWYPQDSIPAHPVTMDGMPGTPAPPVTTDENLNTVTMAIRTTRTIAWTWDKPGT